MNDNKGLKIILTIIALVMGVVSVGVMVLSDRKGPKITIDNREITYIEGSEKGTLLEGISAYDEADGDVSNTLMIKDITVLSGGNKARVTYVARDKRNNISEAYRFVTYIGSDNDGYELSDEELYDSEFDEQVIANNEIEEEPIEDDIDIEEETEVSADAEVEAEADNEAGDEPAEEAKPEEVKPEEKKPEEPKKDDKTPKITLKQKTVNINVGQTFNPSDYIATKENASSIEIDGGIDVMTPGTYPLTFKVTGPDGKKASETLTVVVK